jgi:hypothetical protein
MRSFWRFLPLTASAPKSSPNSRTGTIGTTNRRESDLLNSRPLVSISRLILLAKRQKEPRIDAKEFP